jgi:hypothetical protein
LTGSKRPVANTTLLSERTAQIDATAPTARPTPTIHGALREGPHQDPHGIGTQGNAKRQLRAPGGHVVRHDTEQPDAGEHDRQHRKARERRGQRTPDGQARRRGRHGLLYGHYR